MKDAIISIIQFSVIPGDKDANIEKALSFIDNLPPHKNHFICLPEFFSTGHVFSKLLRLAEDIPGRTTGVFSHVAQKRDCSFILGSIMERDRGDFYNTCVAISRSGKIMGIYRKIHLFDLMDEPKYLKPGNEISCFDLDGIRIGLMICYDLRFPELSRSIALMGAQIIFVPAAFPGERSSHWKILLKARAIENQFFVAGANRLGVEDGVKFLGDSMVVDPMGDVLCTGEGEEGIFQARISLERIEEVRSRLPCLRDRRPALYIS